MGQRDADTVRPGAAFDSNQTPCSEINFRTPARGQAPFAILGPEINGSKMSPAIIAGKTRPIVDDFHLSWRQGARFCLGDAG